MIADDESLGGFFGDRINWKSYNEGYNEIATTRKPGMVVFHRSYCGACQRLGEGAADNEEFIELTKQFVMISCHESGVCDNDAYAIGSLESKASRLDGRYYPRVFFINPDNTINYKLVSNLNNFQYRYYYRDVKQLIQRMRVFLEEMHYSEGESEL